MSKKVEASPEIAKYKQAMLDYLEASKQESKAKKSKEKLKKHITRMLDKLKVRAALVEIEQAIPDAETPKFAVAYKYRQVQTIANMERAKELLPQEIYEQIFTPKPTDCFTVRAMEEESAMKRVVESNNEKAVEQPVEAAENDAELADMVV